MRLKTSGSQARHLARKALADIDAAADTTAASRAGAGAELGCFEHAGFEAGVGQFDGAGESGISAADDGDTRGVRHVDEVAGRPAGRPPTSRASP